MPRKRWQGGYTLKDELNWLFNVTCDDISVILVTAHMYRRTEDKVEVVPTVGTGRHRHFAGFCNVPVLHRHGNNLLYGDSDTPPQLVAFYDTLGIRRTHYRLNPDWFDKSGLNWHAAVSFHGFIPGNTKGQPDWFAKRGLNWHAAVTVLVEDEDFPLC